MTISVAAVMMRVPSLVRSACSGDRCAQGADGGDEDQGKADRVIGGRPVAQQDHRGNDADHGHQQRTEPCAVLAGRRPTDLEPQQVGQRRADEGAVDEAQERREMRSSEPTLCPVDAKADGNRDAVPATSCQAVIAIG